MGLPIGGGNELWSIPYEVKYGVSIAKPIFVDGIVLVCGYWNGSRAISVGKKGGSGFSAMVRGGATARFNGTATSPGRNNLPAGS
jgi:hypothetical protein